MNRKLQAMIKRLTGLQVLTKKSYIPQNQILVFEKTKVKQLVKLIYLDLVKLINQLTIPANTRSN